MARSKQSGVKKAGSRTARAAPAKGSELDALAAAVAAGDTAGALGAALEAWRATRSPELAALIDQLDARIERPAIADDFGWSTLVIAKDPLVFGALVGAITELPVAFLPSAALKLAELPDDPRLGSAACAWIAEPPATSTSAYPFWTQVYKLLERLGDTRVIAAISKRVKRAPPKTKRWAGDKNPKPSQFWARWYGALGKLRDTLVEYTPVLVDQARLAKLSKQVAKLPKLAATARRPKISTTKLASPPLARALAHATKQQLPETIAALLEAWRANRAPELADLIDRATRLLPNDRATLPAEPKLAHAAWQEAFARDPVGELPCLVRHVNVGGAAAATEHVIALGSLPDDPRIARRLAEVAVTHTISPQRAAYWKAVWSLIARTADLRVIPSLRQDFSDFTGTYYDHHRSGKRVLEDFLRAPPSPTLDATEHKTVNQLAAALDQVVADHLVRERALLADIVAHWDDEGPRLVYADWLLERDRTLGQLIVLGCKQHRGTLSAAETKELQQLRGGFRNPSYVFGALGDYETVFDRGLPSQLAINWNSSPLALRTLADEPLLACVDVIELELNDHRGRPSAAELARVIEAAPRLIRVTGVPDDVPRVEADPRLPPRAEVLRLATALEPLIRGRWQRDGGTFTRR